MTKTTRPPEATNIRREFEQADLGDRRRTARLVAIAERLRASPDQSFPDVMLKSSELTALYRLLNNDAVSAAVILEPHQQETTRRCVEATCVLAIHRSARTRTVAR